MAHHADEDVLSHPYAAISEALSVALALGDGEHVRVRGVTPHTVIGGLANEILRLEVDYEREPTVCVWVLCVLVCVCVHVYQCACMRACVCVCVCVCVLHVCR